jgi:hypothetical protein
VTPPILRGSLTVTNALSSRGHDVKTTTGVNNQYSLLHPSRLCRRHDTAERAPVDKHVRFHRGGDRRETKQATEQRSGSMIHGAVINSCAMVAMLLGLASRRYGSSLPSFVAENAGDAFWTALVYCGMSFCAPHSKILTRAAMTLGFAYAIEFSQLYHAPWIDSIRQTTMGGLVLGFQFVWADLMRYAAGVLLCVAAEAAVTQCQQIEH